MSISKGDDCIGKQPFESYALAQRAASRRRNRDVYSCRECGKFHVGGNARNYRMIKQTKRGRNGKSL